MFVTSNAISFDERIFSVFFFSLSFAHFRYEYAKGKSTEKKFIYVNIFFSCGIVNRAQSWNDYYLLWWIHPMNQQKKSSSKHFPSTSTCSLWVQFLFSSFCSVKKACLCFADPLGIMLAFFPSLLFICRWKLFFTQRICMTGVSQICGCAQWWHFMLHTLRNSMIKSSLWTAF